jgi:hypothetical protein
LTSYEISPYRPLEDTSPLRDGRSTPAAPEINIKAPTFSGTDLEAVVVWIWCTETYFRNIRTPPEEYFSVAMFHIEGDANTFVYDLVYKNGQPSWDAFKTTMHQRYQKPSLRSDLGTNTTDLDECFKAGQKGHFRSDCPQNKQGKPSFRGRRGRLGGRRGRIGGKKGHEVAGREAWSGRRG